MRQDEASKCESRVGRKGCGRESESRPHLQEPDGDQPAAGSLASGGVIRRGAAPSISRATTQRRLSAARVPHHGMPSQSAKDLATEMIQLCAPGGPMDQRYALADCSTALLAMWDACLAKHRALDICDTRWVDVSAAQRSSQPRAERVTSHAARTGPVHPPCPAVPRSRRDHWQAS